MGDASTNRTDRLGNLGVYRPFIHAVVNSLDGLAHVVRVFLGDLDILPSSGIGEVAVYEVFEFAPFSSPEAVLPR